MTALSLTNLDVALGNRTVLSGVNANFALGECVAIMGPNGSGKSTLMRTAAGLIPAASGEIALHSKPLTSWRRADLAREVAYLPQGGEVHWPLTVRNIVALGRLPHVHRFAKKTDADEAAIARAMQADDGDERGSPPHAQVAQVVFQRDFHCGLLSQIGRASCRERV